MRSNVIRTDSWAVISKNFIHAKSQLAEVEVLSVDAECFAFVIQAFERFTDEDMERLESKQRSLESSDLRGLLGQLL